MRNSTKIALAVALLGTLGISGLVRNVYAAQSKSSFAVLSEYRKSFPVAEALMGDGDGETNDDIQESKESVRLQSMAKISAQQAQQAAEKEMGGQATRVQLENEDGDLVYSVLIGQKDIKVDAGNAKILAIETPHAEVHKKNRPHSSIRLSEGAEGNGDGETNDDS